jgi:PKD repeat protein
MRCFRTLVVLIAVVIQILTSGDAAAQHQYDRWYFGFKQGLDFRTSPPTILTDGQTNTIEGSAVYCDPKTGDLLFYTDGVKVWDRMHRLMPNGKDLIADQSSTQAALIVPDPGEPKRFYLFHCDQSGYTNPTKGVYYSIVDLRLNSGFGDVTTKNQKLIHEGTEKLTAISICGGEAYWVIAHELITNNYVAWFIDVNGISLLPVKSSIGVDAGPTPVSGAGYLAASPNGQFIASVIPSPASTEIFKFDFESGKLYDRIQLPPTSKAYGVSFSPDNKKVYVCGDKLIVQYDIGSWDSSTIARTKHTINHLGRSEGALKLGPDHQLYVQESDSIGVIQFPNLRGDLCGYRPSVYPLKPSGQFGLPNNIDALAGHDCKIPLARMGQHKTNICESTCIDFKDSSRYSPTQWVWLFEGGSPSISRERNPKNICFATEGPHKVTLIAYNQSGSDTAYSVVRVRTCPVPVIALKDTTVCLSSCVTFRDTSTIATSWQWTFENGQPSTYSGRTPPEVCYYRAGNQKVTLKASNQFGTATAIAYVTVKDCNLPIAKFAHDSATCAGESLSFTNQSRNTITSYKWMFAGGSPSSSTEKDPKNILYEYPGDFQVLLVASNDMGSDTSVSLVHVSVCTVPVARLNDYLICEGDGIWLEDSSLGKPTYWKWTIEGGNIPSSNSRAPGLIYYKNSGKYALTLIVGNSQGEDTITRFVTVKSAQASVTSSLTIVEPIAACTTVDTAIWIQGGCKDATITNITTKSQLTFGASQYAIPANTLLRIPVSISYKESGKISTSVTITFDGYELSVPCEFTIADAAEAFTYSFSSEPIIAGHCTPATRLLSISNNACSQQTIGDVHIVASGANTPFSTDFVKGSSILPNSPQEIAVTYDPTLPGSTDATLVITTASGTETEFELRGIRNDLPKASIGLGQPSAPILTAGDVLSIAVQFESAIGDSAAPEDVAVSLSYNTDLLSYSAIEPPMGWVLVDSKEADGELHLRLTRAATEVSDGDTVARLRFRSFLAEAESTELAISKVACNPDNEGFSTCTLETTIGESRAVTVTGVCGTTELRKALKNGKSVSVIVRPNPIVNGGGELTLHIACTADASNELPLEVTLIDLQGKEIDLPTSDVIRATQLDLKVKLPVVSTGSYVLRTRVGTEIIDSHIVITE